MNDLKVPVQTAKGTELEDFNPTGKQSDGSRYYIPRPLVPEHEHYLVLSTPGDRFAHCNYPECTYGGYVYPHNAVLKDGHVYNLKGIKVV